MNICMKCGWWYGKRGQLKIFRSNWRRNPGLLGDYSGIHDANHVQVWCRRHLQSKNWIIWIKLDQVDPTYQEYAQNFFNLLLLFFLLLSGGDNKPINVQNFFNLLFFPLHKSPGCWSLVPELIGNSRQSPPIQWSWNSLLKTQQSWQWVSSIDDHSPSQNFQRRLPGWMVGFCLNWTDIVRLTTNIDTRALYRVVFWQVQPKKWLSVRLHLVNPIKKVLSIRIS